LWLSIPLLAIGVVGAVLSFAGVLNAFQHAFIDAGVISTPGTERIQCRPGTYLLYTEAGSSSLTAGASSVTVTGPLGQTMLLEQQSVAQSITRDGKRFAAGLGFAVTKAGTYTVTTHSPAGTTVLVAPSITTLTKYNVGWVLGVLASLLAGVIGLILLIVGLVKRSGARKAMAPQGGGPWGAQPGAGWPPGPAGPPPGTGWSGYPGWAPPPSGPGMPGPPVAPWGSPGGPAPTSDGPIGWPQSSDKPNPPG
jgi:hypothetical protein